MNRQDYSDEFKQDIKFDTTHLEFETARCGYLLAKYLDWFQQEKSNQSRLDREMNKLKLEKRKLYIQGASKETRDKGWTVPKEKVWRGDIEIYLGGDNEILELKEKLDEVEIVVDILERMVNEMTFRKNKIDTIMVIRKFNEGG